MLSTVRQQAVRAESGSEVQRQLIALFVLEEQNESRRLQNEAERLAQRRLMLDRLAPAQ